MKLFAKLVDKYALLILAAVTAVTCVMAPGIKRITIARGLNSDTLPEFNSLVRAVREVRETFSANKRQIIISIETQGKRSKVTDPETLELIQQISQALRTVPILKRDTIVSLSTVKSFENVKDGISSEKLLSVIPRDRGEAKAFETKLAADPFYFGRIVSKDFKSTLVLATAYDNSDLGAIHDAVTKAIAPFQGQIPGLTMQLVGEPEINYQLFSGIEQDLILFLFLSIGLILVSFLTMFRSWKGVLLPLVGICTGVIWTMGAMGYYGEPILIISATLPVVLVICGSEYVIHVYHFLLLETGKGVPFRKALVRVLKSVFPPMLMASVASVIGGVSLLTFKIRPIQHFGVFLGLGTVIMLFVTLILVPVLFKLLHRPAQAMQDSVEKTVESGFVAAKTLANLTFTTVPVAGPMTGAVVKAVRGGIQGGIQGVVKGADIESLMDRTLGAMARLVTKHSLFILLLLPVLMAFCIHSSSKIQVGFDNISMLPKDSPIRSATARLDRAFGGTQQFDVLLDTQKPGGSLDPKFLHQVQVFEEQAAGLDHVSHTFSAVHMVRKLHQLLSPDSDRDLPSDSSAVSQYLFLLSMSDGGMPLPSWITTDQQKLRVSVTVNVHDTKEADVVYEKLMSTAQSIFGENVRVSLGGDLVDSIAITRYLVWGKVQNILSSILTIFLLILFANLSIVRGLLTILVLPVGSMLNFALMGEAAIRLDFVSAIITSVAMGIGVDYAIHLISGVKEEYAKIKNLDLAIEKAIKGPGRVMIYNAFCNLLGFSVLFFSHFQAIHTFAMLMNFMMLALLVLSLVLLPAAIKLTNPEFITHHRKSNKLKERKVTFAMKLAFSSLIVIILSVGIYWVDAKAANPTADQLRDKAIKNVYAKAEESIYVMKLSGADGKEVLRRMKIWFKRDGQNKAKLLIKFSEPADIRGTGLLNIVEKGKAGDQWLYLPAIRKVRRIQGGNEEESFLGSDFTMGDLRVDGEDRYDYKITGSKTCGDHDCHELVGTPKAGIDKSSLMYSKKIMLVRKDSAFAVRTELFNPAGQLEKVLTLDKIHQTSDKKWIADRMEMKNILNNHKTVIEAEKRDTSKVPSDSVFTQSNLERN